MTTSSLRVAYVFQIYIQVNIHVQIENLSLLTITIFYTVKHHKVIEHSSLAF
jgi:hypothetical protein